MQSHASPIGARRVKTDLQTSENVFVQPGRSRSNSPLLPTRHHQHHQPILHTTAPVVNPRTAAYLTIPGGSAGPRITITASSPSPNSTSPNRVRSQSSGGAVSPSTRQTTAATTIQKSPSKSIVSAPLLAATTSPAVTTTRSQLPARATRLLTRRLQNNATPTNCGTGGSDSPRSMDSHSLPRRTGLSASYKTATLNQFNNNNSIADATVSTATSSAEDLTLLDKSLRISMLQDVVHFKKQLVRLRRILQETDTLNPFENNNGQFFTTATTTTTPTVSSTEANNGEMMDATSVVDSKQQENTLIKESGVVALALLEDQRQELADLRRQGEITAKNRTIRQQQNLIEKYEAEREKLQAGLPVASNGTAGNGPDDKTIDTISTATQTERLRPLSFGGQEGLARLPLGQLNESK